MSKDIMARKPIHHGNSPSSSDKSNIENRTPQVGGFVVPPEQDTSPLFQESVEAKMRLLANLIIDKMLEEKRNGTLNSKIHTSDCDS